MTTHAANTTRLAAYRKRESETHPYQRFSPTPLQNSFRRIHQV